MPLSAAPECITSLHVLPHPLGVISGGRGSAFLDRHSPRESVSMYISDLMSDDLISFAEQLPGFTNAWHVRYRV